MFRHEDDDEIIARLKANIYSHEAFRDLPSRDQAARAVEEACRASMDLRARLNSVNTPAQMENFSPRDLDRLRAELQPLEDALHAAHDHYRDVLAQHQAAMATAQANLADLIEAREARRRQRREAIA